MGEAQAGWESAHALLDRFERLKDNTMDNGSRLVE